MTIANDVASAAETDGLSVAITDFALNGLARKSARAGADMVERAACECFAGRIALTGEVELGTHRRRIVRIPGIVGAVQGIGAVEHQRVQAVPGDAEQRPGRSRFRTNRRKDPRFESIDASSKAARSSVANVVL